METTISVQQFDGPLGVLLELVEANEVAITEISVGAITEQYLHRLSDAVDRSDMAQFVEIGARLLYIKSAALLPATDSSDEISPQTALAQLNHELEEYRQMRDAARSLERHGRTNGMSHRRPIEAVVASTTLPLPRLELTLLRTAFESALKRATPVTTLRSPKRRYDLETIKGHLKRRLEKGGQALDGVLADCNDRLEIIMTFIAVLELVRSGAVHVLQDNHFGGIHLEPTRD